VIEASLPLILLVVFLVYSVSSHRMLEGKVRICSHASSTRKVKKKRKEKVSTPNSLL
jgi:hypothetical protein